MQNLKPLGIYVFFFALVCERIFIKTHSIESRWVKGPETILFKVHLCIFQPGGFAGWGSGGANISYMKRL